MKFKFMTFLAAAVLSASVSVTASAHGHGHSHCASYDTPHCEPYDDPYCAPCDETLCISHESGIYCSSQLVYITAQDGAEIYYTTDGSKPDYTDTKYEDFPLVITDNTVIRAVSYIDGKVDSRKRATINIRSLIPEASVKSGEYDETLKVALSCADECAKIYYTTDNSDPTAESKLYTKPITIDQSCTLKYISVSDGRLKSPVCSRKYSICSGRVYDADQLQEMFELVNKARAENGLPPLEEDQTLSEIAQLRAEECTGCFSHTRPDGTKWSCLLENYGLKRSCRAENIAYYYTSAQQVFNGWMSDSAHRKNILDPDLKYIGIGYCCKGGCGYWAQVFIGDE